MWRVLCVVVSGSDSRPRSNVAAGRIQRERWRHIQQFAQHPLAAAVTDFRIGVAPRALMQPNQVTVRILDGRLRFQQALIASKRQIDSCLGFTALCNPLRAAQQPAAQPLLFLKRAGEIVVAA